MSGNTGNAFAVNSETGAVTTAAAINYEAINSYTLVFRATDSRGAHASGDVTIDVGNVNEVRARWLASVEKLIV